MTDKQAWFLLALGKSPIGMMGAAFSEMDGDRAGRRRSGGDSIGGIVELAVADDPIPGGKAAQHALE